VISSKLGDWNAHFSLMAKFGGVQWWGRPINKLLVKKIGGVEGAKGRIWP